MRRLVPELTTVMPLEYQTNKHICILSVTSVYQLFDQIREALLDETHI